MKPLRPTGKEEGTFEGCKAGELGEDSEIVFRGLCEAEAGVEDDVVAREANLFALCELLCKKFFHRAKNIGPADV